MSASIFLATFSFAGLPFILWISAHAAAAPPNNFTPEKRAFRVRGGVAAG